MAQRKRQQSETYPNTHYCPPCKKNTTTVFNQGKRCASCGSDKRPNVPATSNKPAKPGKKVWW